MHRFLLFIVIAALGLSATAHKKLSAYSNNYLQIYKSSAAEAGAANPGKRDNTIRTVDVNGKPTVLVFVNLNDKNALPDFAKFEAEVQTQVGNIAVVRIPVENITALADDEKVGKISIERRLKLKNNLTRQTALVDEVHATLDAAGNAFKGKDVVVGVIDLGIDYNHIAFKDAEGNSRVKRVINGSKKYSSATQIASLTTDNTTEDHGTHSSSIAAGGYLGNDYYGMAPEADIVLCGLNSFSDAALIDACKYIIEYAKSEGKPCVINMSLGHNSGPHDGTDEFNLMLEELAEEGVVFCIASGNEGDIQIYLNKEFHPAEGEEYDSISTIIADYNYGGSYYNQSEVEIWNYNNEVPEIEFMVISASTNKVLMTSERIALDEGETEKTWTMSASSDYSTFKKYYQTFNYASPDITATLNKDGTYGTVIININGAAISNYYVAMTVYGKEGQEIHVWGGDSYTEFRQNKSDVFVAGNASKSFNPMCVGDDIVSVGAYNTRNSYKSLNGQTLSVNEYKLNDITSFSSYGEGFNDDAYPDVCAPGLMIFSAYNTYHKTYNSDLTEYVDKQTVNSKNYYWGQMSGTSMATPAVTGIVATWLQCKPTLTGAEVRDVISRTAIVDEFVSSATNCAWGAGKIDANAGLQFLLNSGVNDVDVKQNQVLVYPNPNGGQFKVFTQGEYAGAELNVYSMSGARVFSMPVDAADEAVDVDLKGQLLPGVYVLQITGKGANYSTRMIIK